MLESARLLRLIKIVQIYRAALFTAYLRKYILPSTMRVENGQRLDSGEDLLNTQCFHFVCTDLSPAASMHFA